MTPTPPAGEVKARSGDRFPNVLEMDPLLEVCGNGVVRATRKMNSTTKPSKLRLIVLAVLIVAVGSVLVAGVCLVRRAQRDARRSNAYGRLCQMRLALQNYEREHGTLPPLFLRDDLGKPIHSWRALILPYLEVESLKRLDLSQPWNSDHNRKIIEDAPPLGWGYFARDRLPDKCPATTHIFALLGANSIWEPTTALPKGATKERPNAILLVSVPTSNIEPMQPGDITEDEVRKIVENGHEVLFVMADTPHGYGVVTIERGRLAFHTWQEVLDQRGGTP